MKQIKDIKDRIWETRKVRINTETRLIRYSKYTMWLIPYYSLALIYITICTQSGSNNSIYTIASVIGSIAIIIVSIITSLQKYDLRAYQIKEQYIMLGKLLDKLEYGSIDQKDLIDEYSAMLLSTENQNQIDYIHVKISYRKNETTLPKPTLFDYCCYTLFILIEVLLVITAAVMPIVVAIFVL